MKLEFHYFIAFTSQARWATTDGNTVNVLDYRIETLNQIREIEAQILADIQGDEVSGIESVVLNNFQLIKVQEVPEETVLA